MSHCLQHVSRLQKLDQAQSSPTPHPKELGLGFGGGSDLVVSLRCLPDQTAKAGCPYEAVGNSNRYACFYECVVYILGVLITIQEPFYFWTVLGPFVFGNSHVLVSVCVCVCARAQRSNVSCCCSLYAVLRSTHGGSLLL